MNSTSVMVIHSDPAFLKIAQSLLYPQGIDARTMVGVGHKVGEEDEIYLRIGSVESISLSTERSIEKVLKHNQPVVLLVEDTLVDDIAQMLEKLNLDSVLTVVASTPISPKKEMNLPLIVRTGDDFVDMLSLEMYLLKVSKERYLQGHSRIKLLHHMMWGKFVRIMPHRSVEFSFLYNTYLKDFAQEALHITRFRPEVFDNSLPVGERIWVTDLVGMGRVKPHNLTMLTDRIVKFIESHESPIIIMDCLEYLTIYNPFSNVIRNIEFIRSHIMEKFGIGFFFTDFGAFDQKEASILKKTMVDLEDMLQRREISWLETYRKSS